MITTEIILMLTRKHMMKFKVYLEIGEVYNPQKSLFLFNGERWIPCSVTHVRLEHVQIVITMQTNMYKSIHINHHLIKKIVRI